MKTDDVKGASQEVYEATADGRYEMRQKYAVVIGAICVAFLLWIGLGRRSAPNSSVRIGSILVLSGNYKSMGEQIRDGQLLALEELNAQPGRKRHLELIVYDSQGEKSVALEKVKALRRDSVSYLAEIFGSTEALYCLPFIRQQRMILVSGVDTGASLPSAGGRSSGRFPRMRLPASTSRGRRRTSAFDALPSSTSMTFGEAD